MTNDTLYRTEEAVLSTPVLVFLGSCVLIILGFLLAFLMNSLIIDHLQQAGYVPYNNPDASQIILGFLTLDATPSDSIWYHYAPGQSLAFAFAYKPLAQAIITGVGFTLAGASALVMLIRTNRNRLHPKHGALLLLIIGLVIGCVPICHTAPNTTITIDLQNRSISNNDRRIAISSPMQIGVHIHYSHSRRHTHIYYSLDMQNPNGDQISLLTGYTPLLNQLNGDISNFLNTQGGQL
jgi:hypothetical protein